MSIERRASSLVGIGVTVVALGASGAFAASCGGRLSTEGDGTAGSGGTSGAGPTSTTASGGATDTSGTTVTTSGGLGKSGAGGFGGSVGSTSSGGSPGKAGAGGTAGSVGKAGSTGLGGSPEAGLRDGGADRDVDIVGICGATRFDSGSSCLDTCSCNRCASSTVACYSNPSCRALVECATANRCTDTVCAATKCQAQFAAAGSAIALAQAFATCYFGQCVTMCPTEAGPPDASRE